MRLTPIQHSFAYGEISPDLYGRPDLPQYAQGVKTLVNMFTTAHGAAIKRGGFQYRQSFGNSDNGVVIPFPNYNSRGGMLILADDGHVYLFGEQFEDPADSPSGSPPTPAGGSPFPHETPDPYNQLIGDNDFTDGGADWEDITLIHPDYTDELEDWVMFENDACYLKTEIDIHKAVYPRITQQIALPDPNGRYYFTFNTRAMGTNNSLTGLTYFRVMIHSRRPPVPDWGKVVTDLDRSWNGGYPSVYSLVATANWKNDVAEAQEYAMLFDARGQDRVWITIALENRLDVSIPSPYSPPKPWDADKIIEKMELRQMIVADPNADEAAAPVVSGDPHQPTNPINSLTFAGTHPYNNDQLPWLQYCYTPDEYGIVLTHVNHVPRKFLFDLTTGTHTWAVMPFSTSPSEWGSNNYPRCATYHGNRLWFAGSIKEPWRIWGSKVGDFTDLAVPLSPADDDALQFDMHQREQIHWIESHRDLMLGTNKGEYIITSQGGAITTTDHQLIQQGATGSHAVQPVKVDGRIIFSSADGHRLYSMGYSEPSGGWRVEELSVNARHLLREDTVRQIVLDQHPHRVVWIRTAAGRLLSMTYEETEQGVVASWGRHTVNGSVRCLAVSLGLKESYLYMMVSRHMKGIDRWDLRLERLTDDEYLDAFVKLSDESSADIFTGAYGLMGETVDVLTRAYDDPWGEVHPEIVVGNTGNVALNWACREVVLGFPYAGYLETLPLDLGGRESSMGPASKRYGKIYARIYNSHKPSINGIRPAERTAADGMNRSPRPLTENVRITNFGHDEDASVHIVQDLPYGLYLAGIFGKLSFDTQ